MSQKYLTAFRQFDKDDSGAISIEELRIILEDDDEFEPHAYMFHCDHYAANRTYTNREWYEWSDANLKKACAEAYKNKVNFELKPAPEDYTKHFHKEASPTHHRVVDPFEDEGVWAIVDDGCNSCTHSKEWRLNAEEKWKKLGFKCYMSDSKTTKFTGIGTSATTGKWKMPAAFLLNESGMLLPGSIDSHETEKSKHPLLISQACQAKLGFTKKSRDGTITMDDYENQGLEVARQARTGLFMVRIDHLLVEQYLPLPEQLRSLLIEQPELVESSSEEVAEPIAYVARSRLQPQQYLIPHRTLDRPTVIVSCGLLNFETSAYANGSSLEFQDKCYEHRPGCGKNKFLREV